MKQRLWRVAVAGNCTALILIVLSLANGPLLFDREPATHSRSLSLPEAPLTSLSGTDPVERVLLIVVDGLRADYATDPQVMPRLARLASEGGSGLALVESLIPSTVAGIQTIATGRVPAPASFLEDFGARRARGGGIFAVAAARGWRAFVAGPRLWADLYGPWIGRAVKFNTGSEGDSGTLRESLAALRQGAERLFVVHFGRPDAAAHRYGAQSQEYREAITWCDAAIGQLVGRAGVLTALVVTSDHGVTEHGGHAGPEPAVRATPVVTWGPGMPRGAIGTLRQRDVYLLVRQALGLPLEVRPSPPDSGKVPWDLFVFAIAAASAMASGLRIGAALHEGTAGRSTASALNLLFWIVLLLVYRSLYRVALFLTILTLLLTALHTQVTRVSGLRNGLISGTVFGVVRLGDGLLTSQHLTSSGVIWLTPLLGGIIALGLVVPVTQGRLWRFTSSLPAVLKGFPIRMRSAPPPRWILACGTFAVAAGLLGGTALLGISLALAALGMSLGRLLYHPRCGAQFVGAACAVVPVTLTRLLGETVSLSTLDVRVASALLEGPLGLPAAVIAVIVRHALPVLGFLLGLSPALAHAAPAAVGRFAASLSTIFAAQALIAAGLLAGHGTNPVIGSLALGALVHLASEASYAFLGSALALWLGMCQRREKSLILSLAEPEPSEGGGSSG